MTTILDRTGFLQTGLRYATSYLRRAPSDLRPFLKPALLLLAITGVASFAGLVVAILGWIGLVAFASLFLVGVVLFDFRIGVVALMMLYPLTTARFLPSYAGINPLNLAVVGTVFSYLLHRYSHPVDYRLFDRKLIVLYLLPFFVSGISGATKAGGLVGLTGDELLYGTPTGFFLYYVVKPSILILMAVLIAAAVRESKQPRRFIYPFAIAAVMPAILVAIYVLLSGVGLSELVQFRSFLSVLGLHANQFAVVINFGLAVLMFTALSAQSMVLRGWLLVLAAILAMALALTFSRGGYMGFVVTVLAYFAYYRNWRALFFGILVIGVTLPFIPDAIIDRVTLGWTHGQSEQLSSGRLDDIWLPLLPKVLESPLLGHGAAYVWRSDLVSSGRIPLVGQAHNAYLDLLLEMGLVGFVLVLAFYRSMFLQHRTLSGSDPDALLRGFFRGAAVGVLTVLVQALTDDRLVPNQQQMFMWMAYGIMIGRRPDMLKFSANRVVLNKRPAERVLDLARRPFPQHAKPAHSKNGNRNGLRFDGSGNR